MKHTLKLGLLKLGVCFLMVGTMATTTFGHSALAAGCVAGIANAPGTCDMTFDAYNITNTLSLTANTDTVSTAYDGVNNRGNFSLTTTVVDDRSSTTAGWNVDIYSPGLTNGIDTIEPHIDTNTITGTVIANSGGACATTTAPTDFDVVVTPGSSLGSAAAHGAGPVDCSYAISTTGWVYFTGKSSGFYTGTVTLSLASV